MKFLHLKRKNEHIEKLYIHFIFRHQKAVHVFVKVLKIFETLFPAKHTLDKNGCTCRQVMGKSIVYCLKHRLQICSPL